MCLHPVKSYKQGRLPVSANISCYLAVPYSLSTCVANCTRLLRTLKASNLEHNLDGSAYEKNCAQYRESNR